MMADLKVIELNCGVRAQTKSLFCTEEQTSAHIDKLGGEELFKYQIFVGPAMQQDVESSESSL